MLNTAHDVLLMLRNVPTATTSLFKSEGVHRVRENGETMSTRAGQGRGLQSFAECGFI
jgi:hypothetical protein